MTVVPEIYLGPPGTGKTTTLLNIVDEELGRGVPPDRIGYVTFTRRGAEEAIGRAAIKFSVPRSNFPYFRTLHSLCFRALGLRNGDVMEKEKIQEFADYAGVRISGKWTENGDFIGFETGDRCLFVENLARMRGVPLRSLYNEDDDRIPWRTVEHVAKCLVAFKETHGLLDYTDMLMRYVAEDLPPALEVLIVDEAQDLSALQWRVVELLSRKVRRLAVAGDDDQALYRWAGADVEHLINLEGAVSVLDQSYRVPARVQGLAETVIRRVLHRRPKTYHPRPAEGLLDRARDFAACDLGFKDEAVKDENRDIVPILILARNQYILKEQVEPELRRRGIIYEIGGHSSVRASVLAAVSAWEDLRAGKSATGAQVSSIYKFMSMHVGFERGFKVKVDALNPEFELNIEHLKSQFGLKVHSVWHEALDKIPKDEMSYMLAARRAGEKLRGKASVHLSTIHGSKGGQARHVILLSEMARRSFVEMRTNEDDEHRVYYVGITRARERLTIVDSSTKQFYPNI